MNIIFFRYKTKYDMCNVWMRIQEHCLSTSIGHKVVSQKDIINWWKTFPRGNVNYMHYWDGFNFPSKDVNSFLRTYKKEKLLIQEQKALNILKKIYPTSSYYVITGVNNETFIHELHHALFYLDKKYRKEITKIIRKYNVKEIEAKLASEMAYPEDTMIDEVSAYLIGSEGDLIKECGINTKKYKTVMLELLQLYIKNIIKLVDIKIIDSL